MLLLVSLHQARYFFSDISLHVSFPAYFFGNVSSSDGVCAWWIGKGDGSPHPQESRRAGVPRPHGLPNAPIPHAGPASRQAADAGHVSFTDWALSHDHFAVAPQRLASPGGLKSRHSGVAPAGNPADRQA